MTGKIIKAIAGFYYIYSKETGLVECRARGILRKDGSKPLVGDEVCFEYTEEDQKKGSLLSILPRRNALLRPLVANVDQAIVLFAAAKPEPNLNLLDRFLLMMELSGVKTVICFNKQDIASEEQLTRLKQTYQSSTYPLLFFSAKTGEGVDKVRELLLGRTTVLAGPSGVGKSTLCNLIFPEAKMETGSISQKIDRGKHTTRHSELFYVGNDTYLMDTPGFTSLMLPEVEKEDIQRLYPEMEPYLSECRFTGCVHINEPGCAVKEALEEGKISQERYQNYTLFFDEKKNQRRYK